MPGWRLLRSCCSQICIDWSTKIPLARTCFLAAVGIREGKLFEEIYVLAPKLIEFFCGNWGIYSFRKRVIKFRCLPDSVLKNIFRFTNNKWNIADIPKISSTALIESEIWCTHKSRLMLRDQVLTNFGKIWLIILSCF